MLLSADDPAARLFNVPDAAAVDGREVTIVGRDGIAMAQAKLHAVSPTAIRVEDRREIPAAERYYLRTSDAVPAVAVRSREMELRPEQAAFRERVGKAWGWRCPITGETVREVLDAAHLPAASWRAGDNRAEDGILLRADLHRLLDAGLLRIEDGVAHVQVGSYRQFDGMRLTRPALASVSRA